MIVCGQETVTVKVFDITGEPSWPFTHLSYVSSSVGRDDQIVAGGTLAGAVAQETFLPTDDGAEKVA